MLNASLPHRAHAGSLLLEALLGVAIFSFFLSAVGVSLLEGQEGSVNAGDRIRGVLAAQKTLEATRSVRNGSFSSVTAGAHGIALNPSGTWIFNGTQTVSGSYTMSVTAASLGTGRMQLTGLATWKRGAHRAGTAALLTELTDWRATGSIGNWSSITLEGSYTGAGSPLFSRAAIAGTTLFVVGDSSSGGSGLYAFDISNTASPSRIAAGFSLGSTGYDVAVRGKRLYVLTGDSAAEVKVYNITTPSSLSAASLVTSYNLPGNARGRALAFASDGTTLLVGSTFSAVSGEYELAALDASNSGSLALFGGMDDTGTVNAIAVTGTAAYLASGLDTGELRVADIDSPASMVLASGNGYNLSDRTADGLSIAVTGTSALVGTQANSGIQEMVLFDTENAGVPVPPPGPWYHEGSGSLVGITMDPTRCVAFLVATSGHKALQVVNMRNKTSLPEVATYNATALGRGVLYDPVRDRAFLLTSTSVHIFRPGTSTGTCP